MRWAAIRVTCPAASEDPVAACFTDAGCGGVVIDTLPDSSLTLTGYLPVDDRLEGALVALRTRIAGLREFEIDPGDGALSVRFVEDQDWAEAWKAFFHPVRVGRTLVIKPTWEAFVPEPGDRVIELDPGMAFGTGAHPTTRLCLALLEERVRPGDRVLDLGTGSGILALAAAQLGAGSAFGLDLDPIAVAAARENVAANGLADRVTIAEGGVDAAGDAPYDLVVANILADVIRDLAPAFHRVLRPGGVLIASGIIASRSDEVRAALVAAGLAVDEERALDEWRALVTQRSQLSASGSGASRGS